MAPYVEALELANARLAQELQHRLEDLQRAQAQLANQEKFATLSQLIAGTAHALNNPLAAALACLAILQDLPLPAEARDLVQRTRAQTERAVRVVKTLAVYARRSPPQGVPTDLHDLLRRAEELLGSWLGRAGIRVEYDLSPDLVPYEVDPNQMLQVFVNLLVNARQAIEGSGRGAGTIKIRTEAKPDAVRIEITDNGPGVPPELLPRLFDPFFTTKPAGVGTGLGLSLCQGIVEAHQGQIRAVSEGRGATFVITLPLGTALPLDTTPPSSSARPGRVLVIDDEADLRGAVSHLLRQAGHTPEEAGSGAEGLEKLETGDFDAIILDIRLPDMYGEAFLAQLTRRRPSLTRRVVIITGDVLSDETQDFLERTRAPYLTKPFTLKDLLAALARVMADQPPCD
ncbi:MAG: ATP-binding protein [Candidatus Methylomirabilia bacterium]